MEIADWKKLFAPHILSRGEEYYESELVEIEAMDAEFNTDEHEALTMIPAPEEDKKGKVLDVIQKGYKLNGKVIRFARVVVGN